MGERVRGGTVETAGFHGDGLNIHFYSDSCIRSGDAVRENCYLFISSKESRSGMGRWVRVRVFDGGESSSKIN